MARFVYTNLNPVGIHEDDCVTRAITLASGEDYFTIRKKLQLTAQLLDCPELCVCCYNFLIEKVLQCRQVDCEGLSVEEFADLHPYGVYLVRIDGHLTCVIDDGVYDIWDCRDELATNAWVVD